MSQDLLAEFGSFSISNGQQPNVAPSHKNVRMVPVASSLQQEMPSIQQAGSDTNNTSGEDAWAEDDDDDFGDFEAPENDIGNDIFGQTSLPKSEPPKPEPPKKSPTVPVSKPVMTKPASINAARKHPKPEPPQAPKTLSKGHPFANNPDILFDAEYSDEEGMFEVVPIPEPKPKRTHQIEIDDDFGDFESTAPPPSTLRSKASAVQSRKEAALNTQSATFDLLGFDEPPPMSKPVDMPTVQSKPKAAAQTTKVRPTQSTSSRAQAIDPSQDEDFADWDDFESVPAQPTQTRDGQTQASTKPLVDLPTELIGALLSPSPTNPPPPPTNIPPPSLLLTLFPPLFKATSSSLLHPLSTMPPDQKHDFLSSAPAQSFLRNYLSAAQTLGHIMAGRKNRWKRDKYLAQSMRIGPSVSGRSGGMKLTGLDSNESRREEAECEDVLKGWREQAGRLKSAVTAASTATAATSVGRKKAQLVVPELAITMPVRVAKQSEGGVVSTAACALCGLKREERVAKVDMEVEDSFGEWWVEGTNMHLGCWNFWEIHRGRLSGR